MTGHHDAADIGFDDWFDATFSPRGGAPAPVRIDELRSWARQLFDSSGPVGRDVAVVAFHLGQLTAVESALALVIADLRRISPRVPTIEVDAYERGIRITVDNGFAEPSIRLQPLFDVAEAAVEIVEYIREHVAQDASVVFPVCRRHEAFYLHPAIVDGIAVWRCNRGDHVVAAIGQLPG